MLSRWNCQAAFVSVLWKTLGKVRHHDLKNSLQIHPPSETDKLKFFLFLVVFFFFCYIVFTMAQFSKLELDQGHNIIFFYRFAVRLLATKTSRVRYSNYHPSRVSFLVPSFIFEPFFPWDIFACWCFFLPGGEKERRKKTSYIDQLDASKAWTNKRFFGGEQIVLRDFDNKRTDGQTESIRIGPLCDSEGLAKLPGTNHELHAHKIQFFKSLMMATNE